MNEAKHTPGPWIVGAGINSYDVMADGYFVATCHDAAGAYSTNETLSANARLIAAAPELLYALNQILVSINRGQHISTPIGTAQRWFDVLDEARAAIAKTTGQKQ